MKNETRSLEIKSFLKKYGGEAIFQAERNGIKIFSVPVPKYPEDTQLVAETNGNCVWEAHDPQIFAEMIEENNIKISH